MKPCKKIIGLTGGIATGKSTVTEELIKRDYIVIDADEIAHNILSYSSPAYEDIIFEFGEDILLEDKSIDRKKLGNIVFSNRTKLEKLNDITHPRIMESIKSKIDEYFEYEDLVILDIPLLLEQKDMLESYDIYFHTIVLVYLDAQNQINRLMNRDKISRSDAIDRINSQMDMDIKREKSDYIIDNRGNMEDLMYEIDKFEENILK